MKLVELHALKGDYFTYTPPGSVTFTVTHSDGTHVKTFQEVADPQKPLRLEAGDVCSEPDGCTAFDTLIALGQARYVSAQPAEN